MEVNEDQKMYEEGEIEVGKMKKVEDVVGEEEDEMEVVVVVLKEDKEIRRRST